MTTMINVAPSSSSHHSNSTSDNGTRHPVRRKGAGCIVTAVVIVVVVVITVIIVIIVVIVVVVVVGLPRLAGSCERGSELRGIRGTRRRHSDGGSSLGGGGHVGGGREATSSHNGVDVLPGIIVVIVIIIVVVVVVVVVSIVAVVIVVVVPGTLALLSHAILALRGHRVDLKAVVGAEALRLELVLLTIIVVAGEVDLAATGEVGNGPANVLTGAWGVIEVKVHVGAREQDERRNGEQGGVGVHYGGWRCLDGRMRWADCRQVRLTDDGPPC